MTDTPPKPKRRRWRWLAIGLVVAAVAGLLRLNEASNEERRIDLVSKMQARGAFASVYLSGRDLLSNVPYLRTVFRCRGVVVHIPNADVASAVIPLLNRDVTYIEIEPDVFNVLAPRFRRAAPHATLQSVGRPRPF